MSHHCEDTEDTNERDSCQVCKASLLWLSAQQFVLQVVLGGIFGRQTDRLTFCALPPVHTHTHFINRYQSESTELCAVQCVVFLRADLVFSILILINCFVLILSVAGARFLFLSGLVSFSKSTMSLVRGLVQYDDGILVPEPHAVVVENYGDCLQFNINSRKIMPFWSILNLPKAQLRLGVAVVFNPEVFRGRLSDTGKQRTVTLDAHGRLVVRELETNMFFELDIASCIENIAQYENDDEDEDEDEDHSDVEPDDHASEEVVV